MVEYVDNGPLSRTFLDFAQKVCGVSSLEVCLDVGLGTLLWMSLLEQGLKHMTSTYRDLNHSVIL